MRVSLISIIKLSSCCNGQAADPVSTGKKKGRRGCTVAFGRGGSGGQSAGRLRCGSLGVVLKLSHMVAVRMATTTASDTSTGTL